MRIKNRRIYSRDQEFLVKLREEYTLYGGWDTKLEQGCLTIFAYKQKRPKKKKEDEKEPRNKRAERHARD